MNIKRAWRALWETKESRGRALLTIRRLGEPLFSGRSYEKFSEEAYRKNVIAKRAISMVAQNAAGVPWLLYQGEGRRRQEIERHDIISLLRRPNPMQGRRAFLESVIGFYMIAGNSYVEAVGPTSGANAGRPLELWPLRPDRMKVLVGPGGMPAGWEYKVGQETAGFMIEIFGGKQRSPILHLKTFNPLDDWYGMSPIEAAAYSIDQHNEAGKWNMALLQNRGTPSGALVATVTESRPAGELTDLQYERLKKEIEENISGPENAGKPLLLEGGLDWKEMGLSPKDMDWVLSKDSSARDISLAFGVPAMLLNIPGDNKYANYKEARAALWEETIIPLLDFVRDEFNNWLTPPFGEDLFLDYDSDQIEAIAEKRTAMWDKVNSANFLGIKEKREALGYSREIDPDDVILVPAGQVPLGTVTGQDNTEE